MSNHEYVRGLITGTAGAIAAVIILNLTGANLFPMGKGVLSDRNTIAKLEFLQEMIEEEYLFDVEEDKLKEGLYAGLLAGLGDPYSGYYTPEEYEEEITYTDGAYVGIGVVLQLNNAGGASVITCYENGPGERAGLVSGDLIVAIDGVSVRDWELREIVQKVRNCGKDSIILTVYHKDADEPEDIPVEVTDVEIPAVSYEMLSDHIGYIHILEFTGIAPTQYEAAYQELTNQGMEKLIIDVRDNPGGLLNSVCSILQQILPEGRIVYTQDKNGNQEEITCDGEHQITIPLAVLINENSASASEIFAGSIKDYEVGTLVGVTTFGKGIVQSIQGLVDGSAVKLTIADYYTPKGNNIHKIGVAPDVEVKLGEALLNKTEFTKEEDNQLQEAIRILQKNN